MKKNAVEILLKTGAICIDDEDREFFLSRKWHLQGSGYLRTEIDGRYYYLHRILVGANGGQIVDHINRNPLDNRKSNLRLCTSAENVRNSKPRKGRPFKGVFKLRDKWRSQIGFRGKIVNLGVFDSQRNAALAYDAAARIFFGDFAYLNFPEVDSKFRKVARKAKTSKVRGVSFDRTRGKWRTSFVRDGKVVSKRYDTEAEAILAVKGCLA